ncbi:hypothetical protein AwWohl_07750 [Gammaproteobacteria bacterium]|nr:hypothetical protein AwWohl_07750 [Gammaproteobacteria bacterium]
MLRKLLNLKSKFISVFLSVFDRLFVRIFLSFLFCLVLLTSFTLIVPQFDERRITKLPASISEKIIKEITNKDKVQDKDKAMRPHNYRMWVVDTRDYIGRDLDKEKEDESSQNNGRIMCRIIIKLMINKVISAILAEQFLGNARCLRLIILSKEQLIAKTSCNKSLANAYLSDLLITQQILILKYI